ncbi:hypothetical protein FRC11_000767, partial [Ceratobasidium sp. 423]
MPSKARKRPRTSSDNSSGSNNSPSSTIAGPSAQTIPEAQKCPLSRLDELTSLISSYTVELDKLLAKLPDFNQLPLNNKTTLLSSILLTLRWHAWGSQFQEYEQGLSRNPSLIDYISRLRHNYSPPLLNHEEKSVATEPIPQPSKPSYSSVGCSTDSTPTPSAQSLDPSPSPKSGPRPPRPPCPKKAQPLTPRPRPHQVRSNVRLVACIAGRADAVTSKTPRWKEVPTDCFSSLSKDFKAAAP